MQRRLLNLARGSRPALVVTILAGFLAGLLTIGQALFVSRVVDRVFLGGQGLAGVLGLLRAILGIIFLRAALAWVSEISANAVAVRVTADLRMRLFEKILQLGPAYTRTERTGELVNAAFDGVEALEAYFSQYLPQLVIAALVPLSILVFVFPRDPLSGLILFLTGPLIPLFMYLIGKSAEALTKRQWNTLSRLSAHFFDSLQGLRTLKELGRSKEQARSITEADEKFRDATLVVLRVTFLSALVLELVATISTALVAVEVGLRLLYGQMTFQPALFLLLLAPEFYVPLRMLGLRFHAGMAGTSAARRIFEILDIGEGTVADRYQGIGITGQKEAGDQESGESSPQFSSLSLKNISYSHPGETEAVLNDIFLEMRAGEQIALIGASGAGKSTLVALLLRFIAAGQGEMLLNGKSSTDIPVELWREQFAWVPQNPYLFHDSVLSNLRIARKDASAEELLEAVRLARLDGFIRSLPDGMQTVIGEEGAQLSAGQAQRLALARAFLKDAPILILDEPTSNLDPEQERLVADSLQELLNGRKGVGGRKRTILTIAHRRNTIAQADRVVALEGGRAVERDRLHVPSYTAQDAAHPSQAAPGELVPDLDHEPIPFDTGKSVAGVQPSTFFRLLSFLQGSWGWMALSVALGVLTVGSNIGLMGTSAYLISAAALHPGLGPLQVAIVGVRFFGITRGIFRYAERLTSHNVTFRLLARLRTWFYQKLEPLAPARLMEQRAGDLLSRVVSDVETLENFYVRVVSPPIVAVFIAAGMTAFFSQFDSAMAWSYLGSMLLLGLGVPLLAGWLSRRPGAQLISMRANLKARLTDGVQGLADVLVYGGGADFVQDLQAAGKAYGNIQRRLACLMGLSSGLSILLVNGGMMLVLVLAIPLVTTGKIPGVLLALLPLAALASYEAVMPLPQAAQMLSSSGEAGRRLFEIVDAKPAVEESGEERLESRKQRAGKRVQERSSSEEGLEVVSLSFGYPGEREFALQDITFRIDPGQRIAIVGPSGAGKSTVANILLRFWEYSKGRVMLDGFDLHEWPQDEVRRRFGCLSQRSYFFNDSLRNNLLLARPGAGQEEIEEAARKAHIHDFILGLPKGYETAIGERGFRLSGGERQRLAIARLLLKDAPIFLLDEPTASLDPENERLILDTVLPVTSGHSLLLITHRLVGLDAMEEILVMEHGRIVERGRQAELLANDGLYRRMWEFQNQLV